ncbi:SAM-dependent methyltransferase [Methylibium sp. Root1272]|uniref:SAM-dependent methyltransferase n=1 Tax=Methylibium sp. Root1272 TaxID=1736441 RepID=UPI000701B8BD|nr:SAM-dependent methyltransferase [Methylibium sp. Root1272]KQW65779.1 ribosomal RNA small subunit methyltransferase I [Methylibium sp. Root1272]
MKGRLILVPNTLDLGTLAGDAPPPDLRQVLPQGVIDTAARLRHWVCENAKSTRAFLKRVDAITPLAQPLQALEIRELPRPPKGRQAAEPADLRALLAPALDGHDIGLISEAGLPAVADPGAALVAAAHALDVSVQPLPGPNSLLLALAASGLNGQSFAFVGYVPQEASAQAQRVKELEALSRRLGQTQLMIETPYRNGALLRALLGALAPETWLSVSCGLTLSGGWTRSARVAQWRQRPVELPADVPAVFALLAG